MSAFLVLEKRGMGLVERRRKLQLAQSVGEKSVQAVVQQLLDRRYKWVKRDLRRQNLRKRLDRAEGVLIKQGDEDWNAWSEAFATALQSALTDAVAAFANVETAYFTSRGMGEAVGFDRLKVVENYQVRIGRRITKISEDTRSMVQKEVADWFNTDKGLPDLIEQLQTVFSPYRSELIAATEMGFVRNEVSYEMMGHYGIDEWFWDAFDDAATCEFCGGMHGKLFRRGDPMPPDASHPKCRCGMLFARDGVAV